MFLGMNSNQFITCVLSLILLIIILLSKNLIGDRIQMYFLIIVVLLIIVVCLMENINFFFINKESFSNPNNVKLKNKNCYQRSKQFDSYETKIDNRLDSWREIEEEDRGVETYEDEDIKIHEMITQNADYLSNGESF